MSEIIRLNATPSGVRIGALSIIPDGHARNYVLAIGTGHFFGFAVRTGESVVGYVDLCPHMSVPLSQKLDDYLTPSGNAIHCSWHGALFQISDGLCIGGPCTGARLTSWPLTVRDGYIWTI